MELHSTWYIPVRDVYVDECIHLLNKALMWIYQKEILSINLLIMQFLSSLT